MLNRFYTLILIACAFSCQDPSDQKFKIGFSQCISDHDWRQAMNHSMEVEASLYPELNLTIYEAHIDLQLQIQQIDQMIAEDYDVIIVSPMESEELVPVISKAHDNGIPVILVDRKINSDKYTAFVGADNLEIGRNAGNLIASTVTGETNVIELKIGDNASPSVERSKGFHDVVDNIDNINVIASINYTSPQEHEKVLSRVLDSLQNEPIHYFYAFNDLLAFESWQITNRRGLEDIKFIGVDGLNTENGGIELVRTGALSASILYPTGGAESIKLALDIANGKEVPKINLLSTTVIDKRNADIMKNQFDKIDEHQNSIEKQQQKIFEQEEQYTSQSNTLKLLLILLIAVVILSGFSIYYWYSIRIKKRQLELRNKKILLQSDQIRSIAEDLEESNQAKTNFFTGISHEFKTPITLIMTAVESLVGNIKENRPKSEYGLVYNNSKRLLRLINQLLDFRRIEDRKFNLKASKTNLFNFVSRIFDDFKNEAQKRRIVYEIESNNHDISVFIDRNLMDKVFFNLLSNAFKFTPDKGKIKLVINDEEGNFITIKIIDSGIGIPENENQRIFEPYYQASNNSKVSSGIGLYLTKEIIDLHKGTVVAESNDMTIFTVKLYKGNTHLDSSQIVVEPDLIDSEILQIDDDYFEEENFIESINESNSEKQTLLIIEDNIDLVKFLRYKLNKEFDIKISDGTDAIEKAFELVPDIIICDVNLPEKNGFEICEILKGDLRTSHIPTIMLTALDSKESYIRGLKSGVDLYITKPFSLNILTQSLKTLLYNRDKLRHYFKNNVHKIESSGEYGNTDQKFIGRINEVIIDNLDNSAFSVENLAEEFGVSRVQLYRKVKAILGISISDYIQSLRLDKARSLLKNSIKLTISEVAYSTGFSSPNYFSTAFKNKYKCTPNEFRNSINN